MLRHRLSETGESSSGRRTGRTSTKHIRQLPAMDSRWW